MIMMFNKYVKLTLGEVDIIRRHLQAMSERIRMKTLSGEDIDWIRRLPGFDAKIFKEITGIDLDSEWARHLESLAAQLSRQPLTVF